MRSIGAESALARAEAANENRQPKPSPAFTLMEPLREAPRPAAPEPSGTRRRYRSWKGKSDDEVVGIAQGIIDSNSVPSRTRLWEVDAGLADRLRERGLWARVRFHGGNGAGTERIKKHDDSERHGATHDSGKCGNGAAKAPVAAEAPQAVVGERPGDDAAAEARPWQPDEVVSLAQSMIDEFAMADLAELGRLDPELHALVDSAGVAARLRFAGRGNAGCEGPTGELSEEGGGKTRGGGNAGGHAETATGGGAGRAAGACAGLMALSAEQLRKASLKGVELDEGAAYRLVLAECFRMGTATPYVGSARSTVPKLLSNVNRKLSGSQHRVFRRCWDRMAAEGVIVYNQNRSAASVDPFPQSVRDAKMTAALAWAVSEQMTVGPEWRGRFGRISGG